MKREKGKKSKIFNNDGSIRVTELKVMNLKPVSHQTGSGSGSKSSSSTSSSSASSSGHQSVAQAKWEEVCYKKVESVNF